MTRIELENEIQRICARLVAIHKGMPEMTGMDWANDHGWIAHEEWQAADDAAKHGVQLEQREMDNLEVLREQHPQQMAEFLDAHIKKLQEIRARLQAHSDTLEFAMRFNLTLLPDIIACFEAWRSQHTPRQSMAWAWRIGAAVMAECEKFLGLQK